MNYISKDFVVIDSPDGVRRIYDDGDPVMALHADFPKVPDDSEPVLLWFVQALNIAHEKGKERGRQEARREIRRALGISADGRVL